VAFSTADTEITDHQENSERMLTVVKRLQTWYQSITRPVKVSFFAAVIVGFIAHLPFMANHFVNLDSIEYITRDSSATYLLSQGKWLFERIDPLIFGKVFSAGVTVPIATITLALTAAITTSVLKIQHSAWAAFIGSFLVLFPSVFCTYSFYAATYFFALLLAAVSVYVTDRWRWGWIAGIATLTCALGIYAVYIGYAAGLFLILCMLRCLDNKEPLKTVYRKAAIYLAVLLVSIVLYYAILKLFLAAYGITLSGYRGIDQFGSVNVQALPNLVINAYQKVWYFFRHGIYLEYSSYRLSFGLLNKATALLCVIASLLLLIFNKTYRNGFKAATFLLFALLFPLAIHAIAVLGQNQYTHWMMIAPFVLGFIYMIALADHIGWGAAKVVAQTGKQAHGKKLKNVLTGVTAGAVLLTSILLSQQWFILTNTAYEKLRSSYESTYAAGVMLANDIKKTEDFSQDMPVAFVGDETPEIFQHSLSYYGDLECYLGMQEIIHDTDRTEALMYNFIGMPFTFATDDKINELSGSEAVIDMPVYPETGAIQTIDGVLVVKLSDITIDRPNS